MSANVHKRTVRMSDELAQSIDRARGDVPFERWARRVLAHAAEGYHCPHCHRPTPHQRYNCVHCGEGLR